MFARLLMQRCKDPISKTGTCSYFIFRAEEQKLDDDDITRQLTKRELAYLSPRLGILNNIPFAIPFESRVLIFRSFIRNDQFKIDNIGFGGANMHRNKVVVRRDHVSQDGFDHLNELGAAWKGRLAITFVDKFGQEVRLDRYNLRYSAHFQTRKQGLMGEVSLKSSLHR